MSFKVSFSCEISDFKPIYSKQTVFEMVYVLRNLPVEIPLPSYTWLPSLCKKKIEYRLENQSIGALSTLSYPNFFKLDLANKKVTLKGESFAESDKEFTFRFVATTTDG